MVPLYILGILIRFGSQHGYQIKKIIGEQLSDFTKIKLSTIYYHLEKMCADGLITFEHDKDGSRPEKTIYTISESGKEKFKYLLNNSLNSEFRPSFELDSVFYFHDSLLKEEILKRLEAYILSLKKSLEMINYHYEETIKNIPEDIRIYVNAIFDHHIKHYNAEIQWAEQTNSSLKE